MSTAVAVRVAGPHQNMVPAAAAKTSNARATQVPRRERGRSSPIRSEESSFVSSSMEMRRQSLFKSRHVEAIEARWIDKHVEFDDLASRNREADDRTQPTSVVERNKSGSSIHDGRPRVLGEEARDFQHPFGHRARTANQS